ncbi:MAG TPA: isoaspartyl peptidase/L-asparaginase [Gemmataceae bacterium]|nr:isoaspartyl peptidase/L-asparaginase [Gemmataceae bacterium]
MHALKFLLFLVPALLVAAVLGADATHPKVVLVIHGGAGAPPRGKLTHEQEQAYRADLEKALQAGSDALSHGTSVDAVEAAIRVMEDSPLFNAGKGAVFTHEGRNELDASIMDGKDRRAGAVAGVTRIKNPIRAARAVMEDGKHVLLAGEGADRFALSRGLPEVNPVYFWTEDRWKELKDELDKEEAHGKNGARRSGRPRHELGTVGAVALDRDGNLAAGTSTGGLTNKRFGRIGDSPIIGAGTYADNRTCGVSCTGHGEVFIRYTVARDVAARMQYLHWTVEKAAQEVLDGLPMEKGGVGGIIALDAHGNFAWPYNTDGMFCGTVTKDGKKQVLLYKK